MHVPVWHLFFALTVWQSSSATFITICGLRAGRACSGLCRNHQEASGCCQKRDIADAWTDGRGRFGKSSKFTGWGHYWPIRSYWSSQEKTEGMSYYWLLVVILFCKFPYTSSYSDFLRQQIVFCICLHDMWVPLVDGGYLLCSNLFCRVSEINCNEGSAKVLKCILVITIRFSLPSVFYHVWPNQSGSYM